MKTDVNRLKIENKTSSGSTRVFQRTSPTICIANKESCKGKH